MKRILKKLLKIRRLYHTYWVKRKALSYGCNIKINYKSKVNSKTTLGSNINFNGLIIRGDGEVTIGDNFHSGPEVLILTRNHNFVNANKIPYDENYIRKKVVIEDNVWVGTRVLILPGVVIGEGAIIQAGAVVVKSVPKCAIVGGSPAQIIKYRDIVHYDRLKEEGKFH